MDNQASMQASKQELGYLDGVPSSWDSVNTELGSERMVDSEQGLGSAQNQSFGLGTF